MLKKLLPDEYVASIFDIDLSDLANRGIKGLIIDIDNTLVSWDTKHADKSILEWLLRIKSEGFTVCLLSNNTKDRVVNFTQSIRIPAVYRAAKPGKRAFKRALALMGRTRTETAVIGDQVFTDVFGGKRLGLFTILVTPLGKKEFVTTRLIRIIENRLLNKMVKEGKLNKPHHKRDN